MIFWDSFKEYFKEGLILAAVLLILCLLVSVVVIFLFVLWKECPTLIYVVGGVLICGFIYGLIGAIFSDRNYRKLVNSPNSGIGPEPSDKKVATATFTPSTENSDAR